MIPAIPSPWPRPRYAPDGAARLTYIALLPEAVELAKKDHALFEGFGFETRYRGDDTGWFDGWTDPKGLFGSLLLRTPGIDIAGLSGCKVATIVTGTFEDPADLGYLQRAFVILRLLVQAGAVAVLDVDPMIWWPRADLEALDEGWDFDVADHIRIVFEPGEREPGAGHICHTLGMAKFGRPDLAIGGLQREHAEIAGEMLENLATAVAEGEVFQSGDVVEPEGFPPLQVQEVEDDSTSPDPFFGNRSLWLLPEEA